VSLALSDSPLVATPTRERIKEQARALGYIYNRRAASLRTSRSGIIGVVVHDIMNPFYAEILKRDRERARPDRQTFILSNHYDSVEKQRNFIETLLQLGGDGVIMSPAIGTPPEDILWPRTMACRQSWSPAPSRVRTCRSSAATTAHGIALATNHLIGLGHRVIAMVGGTDQTSTGRDRYQGYVERLAQGRISPSIRNCAFPGPRTKQGGFEAAVISCRCRRSRRRPSAGTISWPSA
jgi:DNA-binding LacI/PurR family transcriptional regulator